MNPLMKGVAAPSASGGRTVNPNRVFSLMTAACVLAALALAFSVGASTARRPTPPDPVIAVVDLTRVLEGLDERTDRESAHSERIKKFENWQCWAIRSRTRRASWKSPSPKTSL
jgi:hypothetical protein